MQTRPFATLDSAIGAGPDASATLTRWQALLQHDQPGIWRYRNHFPVDPTVVPVSLGEGGTPLIRAARFGSWAGLERVSFKVESANPTWSHKDRLASLGVSAARADGAELVVVGSSGNQGAAAAAYCARAGLRCLVLTTSSIPPLMKLMIQSFGAMLVVVPTAADRGALIAQLLVEETWFPLSGYVDPPVGSNTAAIPAYRSLAFEMFEQTGGNLPDVVVIPTSHGDTLAGMWAGFVHLQETLGLGSLPRLVAVEPFGSLQRTLEAGADVPLVGREGTTRAFSIGGRVSTPQALATVRASGGDAIQVDDEDMRVAHTRLAHEGLLVEPSSAMAAAALPALREREIVRADEHVVVLVSSGGLKDPDYAAENLTDVPSVGADLGELRAALRTHYAFPA